VQCQQAHGQLFKVFMMLSVSCSCRLRRTVRELQDMPAGNDIGSPLECRSAGVLLLRVRRVAAGDRQPNDWHGGICTGGIAMVTVLHGQSQAAHAEGMLLQLSLVVPSLPGKPRRTAWFLCRAVLHVHVACSSVDVAGIIGDRCHGLDSNFSDTQCLLTCRDVRLFRLDVMHDVGDVILWERDIIAAEDGDDHLKPLREISGGPVGEVAVFLDACGTYSVDDGLGTQARDVDGAAVVAAHGGR
jgi:hypothetical protein